MAISIDIQDPKSKIEFSARLLKSIQSAYIFFLLGSGCSSPAIPIVGNLENEVNSLVEKNQITEANELLFNFLEPLIFSSSELTSKIPLPKNTTQKTVEVYENFAQTITDLLISRSSSFLPKKATIFSTNYDLFIERGFENINRNVYLCDGFRRNPSIADSHKFVLQEYNSSISNISNIYNYRVEAPIINLVKLHGSLTWKIENNELFYQIRDFDKLLRDYELIKKTKNPDKIKTLIESFSLVFPRAEKFRETILNQTYYELLRYFSNELEKENSLLLVSGFSFSDEHLLQLIKRALRNPTLLLLIFAYDLTAKRSYEKMFFEYANVQIVFSSVGKLSFCEMADFLKFSSPIGK